MELSNLEGNIIAVISNDYKRIDYEGKIVQDIIVKKREDSLKMVGLPTDYLRKNYSDLSSRDKQKVYLASLLHNKEIVLVDFSLGLTKKDIDYFRLLFKRIEKYNRRIILIDKNSELFLNCVDNFYVINNNQVLFHTTNIYDPGLEQYIDLPKIVSFINSSAKRGIKINEYLELDELLKAIYRILS